MQDFYKDHGSLFARIFNDFELPDYAKQAGVEDNEKIASFPDSAFADNISRTLPIHDRAHTFVSAGYAYAQPWEAKAAELIATIEKRAEFFGISSDLVPLKAHVTALLQEPTAKGAGAGDALFQIEVNTPAIKILRGQGKVASVLVQERFLDLLPQIAFEKRSSLAADIITACEGNGVQAGDAILKIAGRAECDEQIFAEQCQLRAGLIADTLEKAAALEPMKLDNADKEGRLKALQLLDEKYNLGEYYGERLLDPHQAVYNKIAVAPERIKVGSLTYPLSQWDGKFRQALEAALGTEKAAALVLPSGAPDLAKLAAVDELNAKVINRYLA